MIRLLARGIALTVLLLFVACYHGRVLQVGRWVLYVLFLPVSFTLTVHLDKMSLLGLLLSLLVLAYILIHYVALRRYARLRPVPGRPPLGTIPSEPLVEETPNPGDWLSKIRIFGYLEPEVYADLLRSLQERTVAEGEVIQSEGGFLLVADGRFELRIRKPILGEPLGGGEKAHSSAEPTELVINQVGAGGVLSSLFDILSIFARINKHDQHQDHYKPEYSRVTKVALCPGRLLIIPEAAFLSIGERHPRAAAHIVQIIMSRFHRVTFMTLQKYLGLSREALHIVEALNQSIPPLKSDLLKILFQDTVQERSCPQLLSSLEDAISNMSRNQRELIQQAVWQHLMHFLEMPKLGEDLGAEVKNIVSNNISIQVARPGQLLVGQRERNPGMFFLLHGCLQVSCEGQGLTHKVSISRPGSIVGAIASIFGHHSLVGVAAGAHEPCVVAIIGRSSLDLIGERSPAVLVTIARRVLGCISPLVKIIDTALEWNHLEAGQALCYQGDPAECIHIILHGRVRVLKDEQQVIAEHGAGESLGELEMLLGHNWPGTVQALRDTEITSMPKHVFNCLAQFHPEISLNIGRILALKSRPCERPDSPYRARPLNLRSVAILPVSQAMHRLALDFAHRLQAELASMQPTLLLDRTLVSDILGRQAFRAIGKLKLLEWLHMIEEEHRLVLYVGDTLQSPWTQRCIRQADCILFVTHADSPSTPGAYERLTFGSMASKELVLVHDTASCPSGLTRQWLDHRLWISEVHHVCLPLFMRRAAAAVAVTGEDPSDATSNTTFSDSEDYGAVGDSAAKAIKSIWQVLVEQAERFEDYGPIGGMTGHRHPSLGSVLASAASDDLARLARRLLGQSVGIVLGGGGARGIAHIGVLQALVEAGVPVDCIGGTSIGSFIGALYARDVDHYTAAAFAKQMAQRLSSKWYYLIDLTYPITSWFTGHSFNRGLWKIFGERHIEDLWLPFFAVTADIAHSRMMVHRTGYTWRYVRASMSLSGFLPPLCDRGALLVDGGYLNNVPVDVMFEEMKAATVIAIDIGAEEETDVYDYGDTLSGWWLILQRLLGRRLKIPTLAEIQSRLAFVSCTEKLAQVKAAAESGPNVLYLRPPVESYAVLDFHRWAEIYALGQAYGKRVVEQWRVDGTLRRLLGFRSRRRSILALSSTDLKSGGGGGFRSNCHEGELSEGRSFGEGSNPGTLLPANSDSSSGGNLRDAHAPSNGTGVAVAPVLSSLRIRHVRRRSM